MTILNLSAKQLRRAARVKDQITSLEQKLARMLGSTAQTNPAPKRRRKWGVVTRARRAKQRGAKSTRATVKPKRKMSVAGRKRLSQLGKARWVKAKAAGKKRP
jgi:hypothetical protein